MDVNEIENTPVFILCGGLGTRFKEETEIRPKPMILVGSRPILWHVMKYYSQYGFRKFVLCMGFKSEMIKEYFLNYAYMNADFTINLRNNDLTIHSIDHDEDWNVTLAYTGELTMTGGRIAIAADKYLGNAENFAVTYGDGLTNVDLGKEFEFHLEHGKIGTILGINPPSRFGELKLSKNDVIEFQEKPEFKEKWINGGYFFFKKEFLGRVVKDVDCVLEKAPLAKLAEDGQLVIFKHDGFWQSMDTLRDKNLLESLWLKGEAPWKIWE
jgi:glucose-1-phosphate cytidylyltransferase